MRGLACSSFPIFVMRNEGPFVAEIFALEISGRYPSGQRGQTVNLLPSASKVRILACPPQQAMGTAAASTLNITLEIKAGVAQR